MIMCRHCHQLAQHRNSFRRMPGRAAYEGCWPTPAPRSAAASQIAPWCPGPTAAAFAPAGPAFPQPTGAWSVPAEHAAVWQACCSQRSHSKATLFETARAAWPTATGGSQQDCWGPQNMACGSNGPQLVSARLLMGLLPWLQAPPERQMSRDMRKLNQWAKQSILGEAFSGWRR